MAAPDPATLNNGQVLAGAAKMSTEPRPQDYNGTWEKSPEKCETLSENFINQLATNTEETVDHLAVAGSPWPENPSCIYMGGFGIGPMNPVSSWDQDRQRCREAGIPDEVCYRPKWRIALRQVCDALLAGITPDWLTFDEGYGDKPGYLEGLDQRQQRYVGEVPKSFRCFGRRPRPGQKASRADDLVRVSDRLSDPTAPAATDIDLVLFYADHGDPAKAVAKGRALFAVRPSVSVATAYAWALHAALTAADFDRVGSLLERAELSFAPREFKRVASGRTLYHWNVDEHQEY